MKITVEKRISYGRPETKKIKKYNRNIIAVKTVKCYNLLYRGVVYACAIFTMCKMKRIRPCCLTGKNDRRKQSFLLPDLTG